MEGNNTPVQTFHLSSFAWEKTFLSHLQWNRQHQQRPTAPTGTICFGWFVCAFFKELLRPINNLPTTAPLPLSVHACTPTNTYYYLQLCSVAVYVFVNGSAWLTFEMALLSIQISKGKFPEHSQTEKHAAELAGKWMAVLGTGIYPNYQGMLKYGLEELRCST